MVYTIKTMQFFGLGFDPVSLIQSGGLIMISLIVFAESGLLVGFFLPGDTLLFSAGFFAAQDRLPLGWLLLVIVVSAILGDNVGYSFGRRTGHRIFRKKDGIVFRAEYLERAEKFYEKHGGKTIIIARFVPVVRTFAPIVAGAAKMERQKFFVYNIIGGTVWGIGITLLGFWLGSRIPDIDKYILPVVGLATVFTFAPAIWHIFRDRENRQKIALALNRQIRRFLRRIGLNRDLDI